MSHFLVTFDRKRRSAPEVERIEDAQEAQERLFAVERELRAGNPDRGVVLLVAEREEDLVKTHGQYFKTVDELTLAASS